MVLLRYLQILLHQCVIDFFKLGKKISLIELELFFCHSLADEQIFLAKQKKFTMVIWPIYTQLNKNITLLTKRIENLVLI